MGATPEAAPGYNLRAHAMSDPVAAVGAKMAAVRAAVAGVIVGQAGVVEDVLRCLVAGGHGLLEGAPGLGKTLLVRALAGALSLRFARVQCTPDLLPADVTGTRIVTEDADGRRRFELVRGPVFTQLLLADEINRATARTQSALLEAMAESQVTLAGERHDLDAPFMVLATQNPIEMEGTYPLPEAQLDRFLLHIRVPRPDADTLVQILARTTGEAAPMPTPVMSADDVLAARALCRRVLVATPLLDAVARCLDALDPDNPRSPDATRRLLRMGPGVRGGQSLVLAAKASALLAGRAHITLDDLTAVLGPALRHRMLLSFEGQTEGARVDALLADIALPALRAGAPT